MEEQNRETEKNLPPLPFTYIKTDVESDAEEKVWRNVMGIRSDEKLLQEIKDRKEDSAWYISEQWRKKGIPTEQIELQIGEKRITVYNFNKDKRFTDEHLKKLCEILKRFAEHFPSVINILRWILLDNKQQRSAFGDETYYPLNGSTQFKWQSFTMQPRGMEFSPHRITKVTNFEGTLVHELSHLIDYDFYDEWTDIVRWKHVTDLKGEERGEWEQRKTPDFDMERFYNKKTGEMAPNGQIPMQPEQCVTNYAKINDFEDFCESMVAFFYDPELLKRVSPEKFEIIQKHDAKKPAPKITFRRIPKDQIKLPEIKPETVYYYVKEPEN